MKNEDIRNLLGGFATDTLTAQERDLLFTAALKDQELFNALADEQALRDCLSDPASRRRLLQAMRHDRPGVVERFTSWIGSVTRRPATWAIACTVVAVLAVGVSIRQGKTPELQMARQAAPSGVVAQPSAPQSPLEREEARLHDASPKAEIATAPGKMKVAVLNFEAPAQAKEADSASADLGKTASEMLGKKLDSDRYDVIDRKEVDKAVQEQKLNDRQLDTSAAASLGRSLGADAVIVGSVKPAQEPVGFRGGVVGGVPASAPPVTRAKSVAAERLEVTATAINTQTRARIGFAQGQQASGGSIDGAVDQVASSLILQFQQNAAIKIDGLVTDVNGKILTLNLGARTGVKSGDRLEVRRAGKTIGHVALSSVQETFSVGVFEGAEPSKVGDAISAIDPPKSDPPKSDLPK